MAAAEAPLTGVALAATPEAAPAGWTVITATVEGAAANLGKGFGSKGGGYLCVSTSAAQAAPGSVVTDLLVLSDRSPQPAGYTRVPEFPEPRSGCSRKKRLLVKLQPAESAASAVLDLRLSCKQRPLPPYQRIGELGNFAVWCKKGQLLRAPPAPRPRSLRAGLEQLSLQPPAPHQSPAPRRSLGRAQSPPEPPGGTGPSAMDGVPFTLHPKFESRLSSGSSNLLTALNVKSLADIEKEYHYTFVVERTAAARLPPSIC